MNGKPDFYIYRGDGPQEILDAVRACWRLGVVNLNTPQEILLVKIDPPIASDAISAGTRADVLGLAGRSTLYGVDDFGDRGSSDAVVWEIAETPEGVFVPTKTIGIVITWREKPTLLPQ